MTDRIVLLLVLLLLLLVQLYTVDAAFLITDTHHRVGLQQRRFLHNNNHCCFKDVDQSTTTTTNNNNNEESAEDPFRATGRNDLMTTIKGGLATIFETAQRQLYGGVEDDTMTMTAIPSPQPRWYPHGGIQSDNPNFRTSAPIMSNAGFARSIWRNVRKRNKPVLWQNALRTYDRMGQLEEEGGSSGGGSSTSNVEIIKRTNIHHEGAMVACAKLGLWQKALEIYHLVDEQDHQTILPPTASRQSSSNSVSAVTSKIGRRVYVTDNMIQSLIRACTRASKQRAKKKRQEQKEYYDELDEQEAALRRIPLDTALEILRTIQDRDDNGIPVAANHVNPVAAAYQSLGYVDQARDILQHMLSNRTAGEEPEDGSVDILNVNDLCAKDKGSYSLLVKGAVGSGDWGAAIEALGDMTRVGLYPNSRQCNSWNEIAERHRRRSWKKKRDDFWMNSVG
eukprot:scaffold1328_cov108-Cylindrotheca_fusiformis.AAC.4